MGRIKGSKNKLIKKIVNKRLAPTEQVRDREEQTTTGFAITSIYKPLTTLSTPEIRDLLVECMWIENCVNTIADEVIKYPLITSPIDKEINSFLAYPSVKEFLMIIRKKCLKDMLRYGNGGVAIGYKKDKPYKLSVVPGYTVRVTGKEPPTYKFLKVTNSHISSSAYKQKTVAGKKVDIELKLKEFMHFQIDADSDRTLARSPIERAYNLILADKYMTKKLAQFTEKGFTMPFFMELEEANEKDITEFLEWANETLGEGAKAFGINQKSDIKNLPVWSAKDIIEMFKYIGLTIGNLFKIPPFMLNLVSDTGSLNAREQKARFLENVIQPILKYEADMYTLILVRQGFNNKTTKITSPIIGTKLTYDRARIARMLAGDEPIFTVDEIRQDFFGKPPMTKEQKAAQKKEDTEIKE